MPLILGGKLKAESHGILPVIVGVRHNEIALSSWTVGVTAWDPFLDSLVEGVHLEHNCSLARIALERKADRHADGEAEIEEPGKHYGSCEKMTPERRAPGIKGCRQAELIEALATSRSPAPESLFIADE